MNSSRLCGSCRKPKNNLDSLATKHSIHSYSWIIKKNKIYLVFLGRELFLNNYLGRHIEKHAMTYGECYNTKNKNVINLVSWVPTK